MNISLCSISFRHHLASFDQIALWANQHNFQGIELWGAHALNLQKDLPEALKWLSLQNLKISMISHYISLMDNEIKMIEKANTLFKLAKRWNTRKIRIFTGNKPSRMISPNERTFLTQRIRKLCQIAQDHKILLLIEYHPNTLTDKCRSTLQLFEEVNHPALKLNFDVIHVWESYQDPIQAIEIFYPYIAHFHFKNVKSRNHLNVFDPGNVYSATGEREGMISLFEGEYDFAKFLKEVLNKFPNIDIEASLEWFGNDVKNTLQKDRLHLLEIERQRQADPVASLAH